MFMSKHVLAQIKRRVVGFFDQGNYLAIVLVMIISGMREL